MTSFVLIFIVLIQKPDYVSMKAWKHPAEFSSAKVCREVGEAYTSLAPKEKVQFTCKPVL